MPVTRQLLAIVITAFGATGLGYAQAPAAAHFSVFGRSTLVSVEAARLAPDTLTLRIRHAADHSAVVPLEVEAAAAGRNLAVTANTDGTFTVSLKDVKGTPPPRLDLLISHDGIREFMSGELAAPAAGTASGSAAGLLRDHKQLAWWILNIAIVLIAAIAISRRMS
jgi:hypothetical protein